MNKTNFDSHLIVRPVRESDIDGLLSMAAVAGAGMTSFPNDKDALMAKIKNSMTSFAATDIDPPKQSYFLVLEDTDKNIIVGTAAVYASVGDEGGFHSFEHVKERAHSQTLNQEFMRDILRFNAKYKQSTLIGTLFLRKEYRGNKNAYFLSRARYMLVGAFRERFRDRLLSEIRGWSDENGETPYWDGLGRNFFDMSFTDAKKIVRQKGYDFIYELMPQSPIHLFLLPQDCVDCIGKPHDDSIGAMKILQKEGFVYENCIDFFDGGPQFSARPDDLKTIKKAQLIDPKDFEANGEIYMFASTDIHDFYVYRGTDMPKALRDHQRVFMSPF